MLGDCKHVLLLQFLAATWLWTRIQSKTKTKGEQLPLLGSGVINGKDVSGTL